LEDARTAVAAAWADASDALTKCTQVSHSRRSACTHTRAYTHVHTHAHAQVERDAKAGQASLALQVRVMQRSVSELDAREDRRVMTLEAGSRDSPEHAAMFGEMVALRARVKELEALNLAPVVEGHGT
jgi:hypothetical protein